ncbi:MAG: hypothetical protein LBT10_04995 [Methanobrevibacter sp.]|jgi:hypothetical protein|nr:hypothetical protein [Methanobrevibacter sp.]
MKLKIFSLIIIAILAVSAIGSVSAGILALNYPSSKPSPDYRWSGDAVDVDEYIGDNLHDNCIILATNAKKGFYKEYQLTAINQKITIIFYDDTLYSHYCKTTLTIKNYNGNPIWVNFWDRGAWRDPHIDVAYTGQHKDGGNGDDITFE